MRRCGHCNVLLQPGSANATENCKLITSSPAYLLPVDHVESFEGKHFSSSLSVQPAYITDLRSSKEAHSHGRAHQSLCTITFNGRCRRYCRGNARRGIRRNAG